VTPFKLKRLTPTEIVDAPRRPLTEGALETARQIVGRVRAGGEAAVRDYGEMFGDLAPGDTLVRGRDEMAWALEELPDEDRRLLERVAGRIGIFADAQRKSIQDMETPIPGGTAGHTIVPVERAGCYAPGGRYPLPSSVLMTAITARAAGVAEVWVASPRPAPITLAAAAIAGADGLLAVGGAQAIAALAFGAGVPRCDVVVGPGSAVVTAAKHLVTDSVRIDMLAGPSELTVLADGDADPALVAADLLAQAEHDPQAQIVLVALDEALVAAVEAELDRQLTGIATAEVARSSADAGVAVVVPDVATAVTICDRLAPEHLALHLADAQTVAPLLSHYGALFIGSGAAEVLGDYGAGPNHTLPTGGTARNRGGLSVMDFLRVRTWLRVDNAEAASGQTRDAARLAELEGLAAHSGSAQMRFYKG